MLSRGLDGSSLLDPAVPLLILVGGADPIFSGSNIAVIFSGESTGRSTKVLLGQP